MRKALYRPGDVIYDTMLHTTELVLAVKPTAFNFKYLVQELHSVPAVYEDGERKTWMEDTIATYCVLIRNVFDKTDDYVIRKDDENGLYYVFYKLSLVDFFSTYAQAKNFVGEQVDARNKV